MIDLDLVLAILHHLLVFSLAAILAMEIAMLQPGITRERLAMVGSVDAAYGAIAGAILVVGLLRVFFGAKGPDAYLGNWTFWAKIGAFALVGILSIRPTIAILRWRRAAAGDPGYVVPPGGIAQARMFLCAEAAVFALIPVFAALMARSYGL
jgi:putative membrane protein